MKNRRISFIGSGNMANCLIAGLINDAVPPKNITASDIDSQKCQQLSDYFSIQTTTDNHQAIEQADLVVLAVKPQIIQMVAKHLKPALSVNKPLVISIAAGVNSQALQQWLGSDIPLIRTMPNTPAMIQSGVTALFAAENVSHPQKEMAEALMRTTGVTLWVDNESQMDAITALSGSGPAYYFLFMEIFQKAAEEMGLEKDSARLLVLQTALGAAKMALESHDSPAELRRKVTSPNGTTESAINSLLNDQIEQTLSKAVHAARDRAIEMSKEFGESS